MWICDFTRSAYSDQYRRWIPDCCSSVFLKFKLAKMISKTHNLCFVALPGADGDIQDEESEVGGGGIQPSSHPRSFILFRSREKDVRSPNGGDLQSNHF